MAMGIKLICLLVIFAVVLQTAQGGKILKKLTKELKKVLGGSKFEDFVENNLVDVADNAAAISSIVTDVSNNAAAIVDIADNKVDVADNAAAISSIVTDVSNNNAAIISNYGNILRLKKATRCTTVDWSGSYDCCTSANPCSIGQGDCNQYDDTTCSGDLKCGVNNCLSEFGFGDSIADCCILTGIHDNAMNITNIKVDVADNAAAISSIVTDVSNNAAAISSNDGDILSIEDDVAEATKCTSEFWTYDCCTSANPCSFGKGDCDSGDDSSCSGDLYCGTDNCLSDFGFGNSDADCCTDASMLRHHVSEECTCQTMTISLSGSVLSSQGSRAGDYHESAIVNGHPSWINADHAIWYSDGLSDWVVGSISKRGGDTIAIQADGQGTTCPNYIASSNWKYWNGSSWVSFSSSVISVTCSQAKVLNGEVHGANSTMVHESDVIRNEN